MEFFHGQLNQETWILAENKDLRHYVTPTIQPTHLIDPEGFQFGDQSGIAACAEAVRERLFTYVILGGGRDPKSQRMREAILPMVEQRYALRKQIADLQDGDEYQIYERTTADTALPRVEIREPATGAAVRTKGIEATLKGVVFGSRSGWYVRTDIYTNKWYPQGDKIFPNATDGAFTQTIYLGGPCNHFVRVRLFDETGKQVASASSYGVARANPDGTPPACP